MVYMYSINKKAKVILYIPDKCTMKYLISLLLLFSLSSMAQNEHGVGGEEPKLKTSELKLNVSGNLEVGSSTGNEHGVGGTALDLLLNGGTLFIKNEGGMQDSQAQSEDEVRSLCKALVEGIKEKEQQFCSDYKLKCPNHKKFMKIVKKRNLVHDLESIDDLETRIEATGCECHPITKMQQISFAMDQLKAGSRLHGGNDCADFIKDEDITAIKKLIHYEGKK